MSLRKAGVYILGSVVGFLSVAPPLPFSIPVMVNSNLWLYTFAFSALLGMFLLFYDIPKIFKGLIVYLFLSCFISQVPYISFNAFILAVIAFYLFYFFMKNDPQPVINFITAAFVVQLLFGFLQLAGKDTLLNFNRPDPVFVGTVMQYMRFASLLAVMAPIIVIKNKWFIIPILIATVLARSCSLGAAVLSGLLVYCIIVFRKYRFLIVAGVLVGAIGYGLWDIASIRIALTDGRVPVWGDIIKSWAFDTSRCSIPVTRNFINCAIDHKSILFGRGLDTFLSLFPIFKQDPNPFPQAHNAFLQIIWELGWIGFSFFLVYFSKLIQRLRKDPLSLAGLVCVLVNMFFTFPDRMIQSMFLLVFFFAYCEQRARRLEAEGGVHA